MKNTYTIFKVNPDIYTEKDWLGYYKVRERTTKLLGLPFLLKSAEQLKNLALDWISKGIGLYFILQEDAIAGYFSFDSNFKTQPEKRYVYFRNQLVEQPINNEALLEIFKAFLAFDPEAKYLCIYSKNGRNDFVESEYDAELGDQRDLFQLKIDDAVYNKMEQWEADGQKKLPNIRLEFYEDIPDHLLEEYCDCFIKFLDDMPHTSRTFNPKVSPDEIRKKQEMAKKFNHGSYRYLAFDEHNKMVGKTNIFIRKNNIKQIRQYMTGVIEPYRGKGLSKWLKAAMYKKLTQDFPELEYINSEVHPKNAPSRGLNLSMGYTSSGMEKEFLIRREVIEDLSNRLIELK